MRMLSLLAVLFATNVLYSQSSISFKPPEAKVAFFSQYCYVCHNDDSKAGGMTLTKFDMGHVEQTAELAEKMIRKLRAGLMPPPGMPRPDNATRKEMVAELARSIDTAAAGHPYTGSPVLHRLNRTEYANSIRDLLGVNIDVSALLPPDEMSHGFDNMADTLALSPALTESYLRAAGKISRIAIGNPEAPSIVSSYSLPQVVSQAGHIEGTPFGTRGGIAVMQDFPADGEYVFTLHFFHHPTQALFGINQAKTQQVEVAVNGRSIAVMPLKLHGVEPITIKTPPTRILAGPQLISASFVQKADGPREDVFQMYDQDLVDLLIGVVPGVGTLPHLKDLSITGPIKVTGVFDTPSRKKIFTCRPASENEELPCATRIISVLARHAFRRPVSKAEVQELIGFYHSGQKEGGFEEGIQAAIQAMIASPEFIFRFEHEPGNKEAGTYRISDLELASRLSYFLWSSLPDDRLITIASQGRLRDPKVLDLEVRRMLADPRASTLATNFAAQWLHLRDLKGVSPDPYFYPNFDRTLADSMRRETELLFEDLVRSDASVLDLLTADYTFVNERLARHYNIPNVLGNRFRRVKITDENRRGLLGQASILLLTSVANRTSPVKRGKYVMEVLLGTPPPPPPPNVPALRENSEERTAHVATLASVRERMEQHRQNPACAGCHKLMDPIGFALENFDAVGAWRSKDSGAPIDAQGVMFDGTQLNGPASLRQSVLGHSDAFVETFTENLLAYGAGRVLDYRDMPAARSISRQAAQKDYRFSAFIMAIVKSAPFQMRTAEKAGPSTLRAANGPRH